MKRMSGRRGEPSGLSREVEAFFLQQNWPVQRKSNSREGGEHITLHHVVTAPGLSFLRSFNSIFFLFLLLAVTICSYIMSRIPGLEPEYFAHQLPPSLQSKVTSRSTPSHLIHKLHAKEISLLEEVQTFLDSKVEEFKYFAESLFSSVKSLDATNDSNSDSKSNSFNDDAAASSGAALDDSDDDDSSPLTKMCSPLSPVYEPPSSAIIPLKSSLKSSSLKPDLSNSECSTDAVCESSSANPDASSVANTNPNSMELKKKKVMFSDNDQIAIVPSLSHSVSPEQSFVTIGEIFGHGKDSDSGSKLGFPSISAITSNTNLTHRSQQFNQFSHLQLSSSPSAYLSPPIPSSPAAPSSPTTPSPLHGEAILAATDEDEISHNGFFYNHEEDHGDDDDDDDDMFDNDSQILASFNTAIPNTSREDEENYSLARKPPQEMVEALKAIAIKNQIARDANNSEDSTQELDAREPHPKTVVASLSPQDTTELVNSLQSSNSVARDPKSDPSIEDIEMRAEKIEENAIKKLLPQTLTTPLEISHLKSAPHAALTSFSALVSRDKTTDSSRPVSEKPKNVTDYANGIKKTINGSPNGSVDSRDISGKIVPDSDGTAIQDISKDDHDNSNEDENEEDDSDDEVFQFDETLGISPPHSLNNTMLEDPLQNFLNPTTQPSSSSPNMLLGSLPSNQSRTTSSHLPTVVGSLRPRPLVKYKARNSEHSNAFQVADDATTSEGADIQHAKLSSMFGATQKNTSALSAFASSLPIQITVPGTWNGNTGTSHHLPGHTKVLGNDDNESHNATSSLFLRNQQLTGVELDSLGIPDEDISMYASPGSAAQHLPQRGMNPGSMSFSQRMTFERWNNKRNNHDDMSPSIVE